MTIPDKFRFRKLDNIGAADAEEDEEFLKLCFINTGDLESLRDCSLPNRLVVGRTGSGKSALLLELSRTEERCIRINPESLALVYISNSTILQFFSDLGVKLDIFFKLLWRHVFTVEILKYHFKVNTEEAKAGFWDSIKNLFRDKKHTKAIEYLRTWGESFWEETEYRIKELTTTLENNLKAEASAKVPNIHFSLGGAARLTEEEKQEVLQRAQRVVNNVQVRQLSDILELLDDILTDTQKRYFITIDRLDENWIEDNLRYRLIRALIETVKDFRRVRNAKIVVGIRLDLLDRVFRLTRDTGFQEEKYEPLYLPVSWTKESMIELLNKRVNHLIRRRYSKQNVSYLDILPSKFEGEDTFEYMLKRTMMRPRDLILFFNECIAKSADKPQITVQIIREAEAEYSKKRLRSLGDEWVGDYPNLVDFAAILKGQRRRFRVTEVSDEICCEFALEYLVQHMKHEEDELSMAASELVNQGISAGLFRATLFQIFHRVGLVGLKLEAYESFSWTVAGRKLVPKSDIKDAVRAAIQPTFWRVLGIKAE